MEKIYYNNLSWDFVSSDKCFSDSYPDSETGFCSISGDSDCLYRAGKCASVVEDKTGISIRGSICRDKGVSGNAA